MSEPLYSVGTWDMDAQAYTRQDGLSVPSENVPFRMLFTIYRELRAMGYSCFRHAHREEFNGNLSHDDNDAFVLIERTDGQPFDGRR